MLLKTLVLVFILYFVVRATGNLLRAMRQPGALGPDASDRGPGAQAWWDEQAGRWRDATGRPSDGRPTGRRQDPRGQDVPQRATRDELPLDIEDAKFEDL